MQTHSSDIIITGAGIVGLTLACALAQQTSLSILILEAQPNVPTWSAQAYHHRVSAIALSSQRIFQSLNVWDVIQQKRVSPFIAMQVWDAAQQGEIHFDSRDIAQTELGFIVENNLIQHALWEKIKTYPQIQLIAPVQLSHLQVNENDVVLTTTDQQHFSARLAIAADGAQSWLRSAAGIPLQTKAYGQQAIVAEVTTAEPHAQTARQVFLPSGPLAFLPLQPERVSSIVWSAQAEDATRLLALDEQAFTHELTQAFSSRLGAVESTGRRFAFPLQKQQAQHYVTTRIALAGDAAHTVHPLAGQGVNMGLLDAASLAEVIADAVAARRDFSSGVVLRRYERWRRADNLTMAGGIDLLKNLFASDKAAVQSLRSFGMSAVNQTRFLKNIFSRHAVGERKGLPRMAG